MDVYFISNTVMNFVLLFLVGKVTKSQFRLLRISIGSIAGAVGACILLIMGQLSSIIQVCIGLVGIAPIMVAIAFPHRNLYEFRSQLLHLYFVTSLIGGILTCLIYNKNVMNPRVGSQGDEKTQFSIWMIGVIAVVIIVFMPVIIRIMNHMSNRLQTIYQVTIFLENRMVTVKGLYDTGNHLREPISKKPVTIVEDEVIKTIMEKELEEYNTRIKLIPYRSIGQNQGMLYGLLIDEIEVQVGTEIRRHKDVVIGIYHGTLSSKKEYQAILHEEML